jgi:hypothetical protein
VPATPTELELLRRWARQLDSQFRVPGTNIRFGWDPILGLVPGLGDLVAPLFAVMILFHAWKLRVPKVIMARMVVNAGIDAIFGIIPVLGNVFDVFWKANRANVALIERHVGEGGRPRTGDWLFVAGALMVALAFAMLPILIVVWIGRQLF